MSLWLKLMFSFAIVAVVLYFMWRIPRRDESFFGWAPRLALTSAWMGLIAAACAAATWVTGRSDPWITLSFMAIDPAAIAAGTLVLWIYRRYDSPELTVQNQRAQAHVGIVLAVLAVAIGYAFILFHRAPDVPLFGG